MDVNFAGDCSEEDSRRKVRNVCIVAHVDHGKTTLADHLIADCGGGVLHRKLAGRVRYMDSTDEEQRRAITMKSSAISLLSKDKSHRVNLVDSPGHMDFCGEVSAAARVSDGALVLVDAIEGVHIQTHAVLRQAWVEKLAPCLVINKIDRLVSEVKLTPAEAYLRLQRIIHEVNNIFSTYRSEKYLNDVDSLLSGAAGDGDYNEGELLEEDDEEDTFQPQKGNVVFACALDGWGFGIEKFAQLYANLLGAKVDPLKKALWGPWYYNTKTQKIVGKKAAAATGAGSKEPMFVEFVLKPIWDLYNSVLYEGNSDNRRKLEQIVKKFGVVVSERDLKSKDPKVALQAVMSEWLRLSDAVLSMVINCVPDPVAAQSYRISRLLPKRVLTVAIQDELAAEFEHVRRCVAACDASPDAPLLAFVAKMFSLPVKMLPHTADCKADGDSEECFLAFVRVFSGVLRAGRRVLVLSDLYDPLNPDASQRHMQEVELQELFVMMGQNLTSIPSVCAGNLVAVKGLGYHVSKTVTLSSTQNCWPFSSMMYQVSPLLRVAIEPHDPADMAALMKGLRLLNRADPFVEITVSNRGEQVLAVAGEVHLEKCKKDLEERFARVRLTVSPPLVSFKETIEGDTVGLVENWKLSPEYVEKTTPNGRCIIRVHVFKLPVSLTKVFEENASMLEDIMEGRSGKMAGTSEDSGDPVSSLRRRMIDAVDGELESISGQVDTERLDKCKKRWLGYLSRMWALGPRYVGPNILLVPGYGEGGSGSSGGVRIHGSPTASEKLGFTALPSGEANGDDSDVEALRSSIVSGFQLATEAGPLCDEQMWGLGFVVDPYLIPSDGRSESGGESGGVLGGQVMAVVKEACRMAVLKSKPRLVEAMYFCELTTRMDNLRDSYAVLSKRRARVLKEEMQEGSALFTVHAYLPAAESFGFSDELRVGTSGSANALLVPSHWEEIPQDPFFVPKTEEEIEEFGDGSSIPQSVARKLIDAVRRRKGLHVEEKVIQHATKQRTLARKV